MPEANDKILSSIKITLDYLQTLYTLDVQIINDDNYREYENNIVQYEHTKESYYKFEKMFKFFTKMVKYYYRYNRMNENSMIDYSYCFYLFYLIEFDILQYRYIIQ